MRGILATFALALAIAACGGAETPDDGGGAADPTQTAALAAQDTLASMATARAGHTATLLRDGRVLVAGGSGEQGALDSCEVYSPSTNTWRSAAPLKTRRAYARAVALTDGRVMVIGGFESYGSSQFPSIQNVASSEIYDPATDAWTTTTASKAAHAGHTATLLADGRVLVTGGVARSDSGYPYVSLTQSEIYDPAADRWTDAAPLPHPRSEHTAALQSDGRVLVAGFDVKHASSGETLSLEGGIDLYDPVSNRWSTVTLMVDDVSLALVAALPNGKVLVNRAVLNVADIQWTATAGVANDRSPNAPHVVFPDGAVMTAGGGWNLIMAYAVNYSARQDFYDPLKRRWSAGRSLTTMRHDHTMTLLADGRVLVAGGRNRSNALLRGTEQLIRGAAARPRAVRSDFNGDRKSEILWMNIDTGAVRRWVMNGLTRVADKPLRGASGVEVVGVGDVNGDATSDILWSTVGWSSLPAWLMRDGARVGSWSFSNVRTSIKWTLADFDGSGFATVQSELDEGLVTIEHFVTSEGFPYYGFALGEGLSVRATGDFNGDRRDDLVVQDGATGATSIRFMRSSIQEALVGPRRIGDPVLLPLPARTSVLAAADLNGDGKTDLLLRNRDSGAIEAWLMNGTRPVTKKVLLLNKAWTVAATPDLNGDGKADILLRRASSGQVVAWLMNGVTRIDSATLQTSTIWVPIGP